MKTHALAALIPLSFLALPAAASDRNCAYQQPQELQLDLDGVRTIRFDIGSNRLRLDASSNPSGRLSGRACASAQAHLARLRIEQDRQGDELLVRLVRDPWNGISFGRSYYRLDLQGSVPDNVLVKLEVGSGDAWLTGAAAMSADVGSGDVEGKRIRGLVTAKVGSGDIELDDIGSLKVLSIGSGDIEAKNVRGPVEVGSIGSGDFDLRGGRGDVQIGSIGSGDADLRDVEGNITVGSIGSGDLDARNIRGNLTVRSKGSGDVSHSGVTGTVEVPGRR